jgi:hypothetical protein
MLSACLSRLSLELLSLSLSQPFATHNQGNNEFSGMPIYSKENFRFYLIFAYHESKVSSQACVKV